MSDKIAIIWVLLLSLVAGVPASANAQSKESGKADPRIAKALEDIGFKYQVTPLGNCRLSFNLPGGREHLVFVSSRTDTFDGLETRRVWATVSRSPEPPTQAVASKLLMDNLKQKLGAFELGQTDDGGYKISYSARVAAACPVSTLRAAIRIVLYSADDKEKELTGKDEH
jgi:hypothetical protein